MDPDGVLLQDHDPGQDVQKSCHILPIDSSNFYHDHNKYNVNGHSRLVDGDSSSNFGSDADPAISIQEDYDDDDNNSSEKRKAKEGKDDKNKAKKDKSIDEDDPQIQNVRLMEKHAQIQRGMVEQHYASSADQSQHARQNQQPWDMSESQYSKQAELMANKISQAKQHQTIAYNTAEELLNEEQLIAQQQEEDEELNHFKVYKKEVNLEGSSPDDSPDPHAR